MFDWVQVRALAGPLKDIRRLVPKPLLHCLGYVLRVIVMLEGEPSPQSDVLSALEQRIYATLKALKKTVATVWLRGSEGCVYGPQGKESRRHTVPVKSLDTPTHSRVFLYFYYFLHCRIIVKTSKQ